MKLSRFFIRGGFHTFLKEFTGFHVVTFLIFIVQVFFNLFISLIVKVPVCEI